MMLQTCCYRFSLKTGALFFGIFFLVNALFHLFVGFFFFISKNRFDQDEVPRAMAAGSIGVGAVQLISNVALIEGVIKRCRFRLALWEMLQCVLLAAYAAACVTLWVRLLGSADSEFRKLRNICPQLVAAVLVLLTLHGAAQVYAMVVVESLRRKYLSEAPKWKADYNHLERH